MSGLLGLSLVAAACGGSGDDDSGDTATAATSDQNVKDAVGDQIGGTATTEAATGDSGAATTVAAAPTKKPTNMEEWKKLWESERAAVVKKIKDNKWGTSADGKTATGPEGFTLNLAGCPAGWSNTEGLSDTAIKIGHTTALSGTLADYGNIAKAMELYFKDQGPIKDSAGKTRDISLVIKDDNYDAARTIPLVDELLTSEKVFAMWTLGSPNTMKTYDKINASCVPQPLSMTGHPAWGDPVKHPWTTGYQMAYNTEAVFWGSFIDQRFSEIAGDDGKVTLAALFMNNDFGKSYDVGMKAYLNTSANKANIEYVTETIEPAAPTVTDPMTTLASKNPDVFIAMTAGAQCIQSINAAAENGMKASAKYLFMPSVCKSASFMSKEKVGGDGMQSDGWWIIGGGQVDFNSPTSDNNPFVSYNREMLTKGGVDYKSSGSFGSGISFAWAADQALRIAADLDGGLTRSNLIIALRSMEMTNPNLLEGVRFNMNGNKDAFFIEGSDIAKYNGAKQGWDQQGAVVELSGKSANCAWDQAAQDCK